MIRELQHIEMYKEFINQTSNYQFEYTSEIEGDHICKIPTMYEEQFNKFSFMKVDNNDKKYDNITELFESTTDKVYTYTLDNEKTLQYNFRQLLPILLDKNTYGALLALPTEYNLNNFRSSSAAYMNLTNPLSLIDTESNNTLWRLFSNHHIQVYIFKYNSNKYDGEIDESIKELLYTYLSTCCGLFYNDKIKKLFNNTDKSKKLKETNLFMQQRSKNGYVEHTIFNHTNSQTPISNYITYSDIIVNDSVAPHYAIWKMFKKEYKYLEGLYLQHQPMFSPNVNFASGVVCTGRERSNTPKGINTLIVSNLQSAFTKNLIHKKYTKYWVDINKFLAIKWLEKILNISIFQQEESNNG